MKLHNSIFEALSIIMELHNLLWSYIIMELHNLNYGAAQIVMELYDYGVLTLLALHTDMFF